MACGARITRLDLDIIVVLLQKVLLHTLLLAVICAIVGCCFILNLPSHVLTQTSLVRLAVKILLGSGIH